MICNDAMHASEVLIGADFLRLAAQVELQLVDKCILNEVFAVFEGDLLGRKLFRCNRNVLSCISPNSLTLHLVILL